jgi:hypothetical protein
VGGKLVKTRVMHNVDHLTVWELVTEITHIIFEILATVLYDVRRSCTNVLVEEALPDRNYTMSHPRRWNHKNESIYFKEKCSLYNCSRQR